jgi:serine/threonine-protein kinase HipA
MTDSLAVIAGDSIAGTLTRLRGGTLQFDYDEAYAASQAPTPLSLSMPTTRPSHPDHLITPWLWGLLPDDPAVLARWARHFDLSRSTPFALLATPVGADCAGAVRFARPEKLQEALSRDGHVTWLTSDDMALLLRGLRTDPANWLGTDFTGQFSLAGAQAKTALLYRDGRWGIPSGSTPTTHILKPAIPGLVGHDLNEHLCLDAARRAGLGTVTSRIGMFDGESAIIVARYDRIPAGDGFTRIHQEDLCQSLSVPPTRRYQNEGGPGPSDAVELFRRAMAPRAADQAIRRFADALIWNWLIAGTDAHAKNYSLLLHGGEVRLAPLYDIASALPYGDHEKKLRLAMKVGGDYQLNPHRNRWPDAARELGLDPGQLVTRARQLAAIAPDAFADAAKAPDVAVLGSSLPARIADLVAERSARCARLLGALRNPPHQREQRRTTWS